MLERPLRLLAIACSLFVAAGWLLFAIDQTNQASKASVAEIAGTQASSQPDPNPQQERARERIHGKAREFIDDVNDVLLRPFAGVTANSSNEWVRRSIPAALALLVYGFGLGMLARHLTTR